MSHEREATKSAQSPLQRGRGYASPWKGRWLLGTNGRGGFNDSCESIFSQLSFPGSLPRDGSLDDRRVLAIVCTTYTYMSVSRIVYNAQHSSSSLGLSSLCLQAAVMVLKDVEESRTTDEESSITTAQDISCSHHRGPSSFPVVRERTLRE